MISIHYNYFFPMIETDNDEKMTNSIVIVTYIYFNADNMLNL